MSIHQLIEPIRTLLDAEARRELPFAIGIDVAEIPWSRVARSVLYGEDGAPAPEFQRAAGQIRHRGYVVEYDVRTGVGGVLPFATDRRLFYALLFLAAEQLHLGNSPRGRIYGITFEQLARLLGLNPKGGWADRVRESLRRLSDVRIRASLHAPDDADDVLEGKARPRVPRRPDTQEVNAGLLSVAWREDGEMIDYVQIDDLWMSQGAVGWAAWIHLPLYSQLDLVAQRLYDLSASHIALGSPEWTMTQDDLRRLLGLSPRTADNDIRKEIRAAAKQLSSHGVLSQGDFETRGKGRGKTYLFRGTAGPALAVARLLRGAGAGDPPEMLELYAMLGAIGLSGDEARELLEAAPADLMWAVLYFVYTRDTQPEERQIRYPAAFVRSALRQGRNLIGDVAFYRWYTEKTAVRAAEVEEDSAPASVAPSLRALPPALPPRPEPGSVEADAAWSAILPRALERLPLHTHGALRDAVPFALGPERILTIRTMNSYFGDRLRNAAASLREIAEECGAAASVVVQTIAVPPPGTVA